MTYKLFLKALKRVANTIRLCSPKQAERAKLHGTLIRRDCELLHGPFTTERQDVPIGFLL